MSCGLALTKNKIENRSTPSIIHFSCKGGLALIHFNFKYVQGLVVFLILLFEFRDAYFKGFKTYLKSFSLRPYTVLIGLMLVVTGLVMTIDSTLLHLIQAQNASFVRWMVACGSFLGKHSWLILIGLYLITFLSRVKSWRKVIFSALFANFLTGVFSVFFKFTVLRARPYSGFGPFSFFNLNGLLKDRGIFQSFPSGDVAVVVGAAAYFFYTVRNRYAKLIFLLLPIMTALARVSLNRHWPSDTLFSIGLGLIAAQFVWNYRRYFEVR